MSGYEQKKKSLLCMLLHKMINTIPHISPARINAIVVWISGIEYGMTNLKKRGINRNNNNNNRTDSNRLPLTLTKWFNKCADEKLNDIDYGRYKWLWEPVI